MAPTSDQESNSGPGWPLASVGSIHGRVVHSRRVRVLANHFSELLPAGHTVLDVGCGDGLLDRLVMDRRSDLSISGVDVFARRETHIDVATFDGKHLPYPNGAFDTVLFSDVLHHTDSPLEMVKEATRVARSCIVIKDHTVEGFLARPTLRFMDFVGNAPHGVVLPYNYLTQPQWDSLFAECRLTAREVRRRLGLYPTWADLVFGRSLHFAGIFDIQP